MQGMLLVYSGPCRVSKISTCAIIIMQCINYLIKQSSTKNIKSILLCYHFATLIFLVDVTVVSNQLVKRSRGFTGLNRNTSCAVKRRASLSPEPDGDGMGESRNV